MIGAAQARRHSIRVRRHIKHDPKAPRYGLTWETKGGHPLILEAIKQSRSLYENPGLWHDDLGWMRAGPARRKLDRFRRSERREAFALVMHALLWRMDLLSMRVGRADDRGRWFGLTVRTIGGWVGLSDWSVERALTDLRTAGFLSRVQPRTLTAQGDFVGLAAITRVEPQWFRRVGLHTRLGIERKRAYRSKVRQVADRQPPAADSELLRRFRKAADRTAASVSSQPEGFAGGASSPAEAARYVAVVLELRAQHPDASRAELEARAQALIRPPP